MEKANDGERVLRSVITVGGGRGFVVEVSTGRYVITAAHCLPWFPPCHGFPYAHERTYENLLAPLGEAPTIWAECRFVDPIGDIAILGAPDGQELYDEAEAYEALVENATPIRISAPAAECNAYLLSLENKWFESRCEHTPGGPLWLSNAAQDLRGGMSGSPIAAAATQAAGTGEARVSVRGHYAGQSSIRRRGFHGGGSRMTVFERYAPPKRPKVGEIEIGDHVVCRARNGVFRPCIQCGSTPSSTTVTMGSLIL
jgi:hypothetical protein